MLCSAPAISNLTWHSGEWEERQFMAAVLEESSRRVPSVGSRWPVIHWFSRRAPTQCPRLSSPCPTRTCPAWSPPGPTASGSSSAAVGNVWAVSGSFLLWRASKVAPATEEWKGMRKLSLFFCLAFAKVKFWLSIPFQAPFYNDATSLTESPSVPPAF